MQWFDLRSAEDPQLDELAAKYQIHPLHIEDCRHQGQNAKIEETPHYIFAVLKTIDLAPNAPLVVGDLDVFLGPDFVISVEEVRCVAARNLLDIIHQRETGLRADQLFHRIMDAVIDSYLPALDELESRIDTLEDAVIDHPRPEMLQEIFTIKRTLLELRRILANTRDLLGHLQRTENPFLNRDLWPFLRDVYDHIARNLDHVEVQRDLLNGTLDLYLSSVANRTNEVMRVLTILGTIALPALVVSSFYGMNLKYLPGLDSPHAFAIVAGAMLLVTLGLLWYLKKQDWI